jgi:hypothetical protein
MSAVHPAPSSLVPHLERIARTELSRGARVGYALLAVVASAMTIVVVSLWLTEPTLPLRTHIAFAAMTLIGLSWGTFSVWVLRTRRVMIARHRVMAGRLAVTFTGLFAAGCLALVVAGHPRAMPALGMSLVQLLVAVVLWWRAAAAHAALLARRTTIERELAGSAR